MRNKLTKNISGSLKQLELIVSGTGENAGEIDLDIIREVEAQNSINKLKAESSAIKVQIELLTRQIEVFEAQRSNLGEKMKAEQDVVLNKLKLKCEELDEEVKRAELSFTNKENDLKELKESLKEKERSIKELQKKFPDSKMERELKELKQNGNIEELKAGLINDELEASKQIILSVSEERDLARLELINIRKVLANFIRDQKEFYTQKSNDTSSLQRMLEESERLIQNLQTQLISSTDKLELALKENERLQETVESMKKYVKEAQEHSERMEIEERVARVELEKITKELNEKVEKLAKVLVENKQCKLTIEELEERIKLLESIDKEQ